MERSGWQNSDSSKGLNSSFLDTNPIIQIASTSHDSVRKDREINVWPHHRNTANRTGSPPVDSSNLSLRQWLDNPERKVNDLDCLQIFTQVVEVVSLAHSRNNIVHSVRPSCFAVSSLNQLSFIESASCSGSGSDSQEKRAGDNNRDSFPMKQVLRMESDWYLSPEEFSGAAPTRSSDIYKLGVLLFELFCEFGSPEEKSSTMANMRHRLLPPQLLLKWSKEASFCMWLLHPDPSGRPKMSELLKSEFLSEQRVEIKKREVAIELDEQIVEQELVIEFLTTLHQRNQDATVRVNKTLSSVDSDCNEATKIQAALRFKRGSNIDLTNIAHSNFSVSRKRNRLGLEPDENEESEIHSNTNSESAFSESSRLMKTFEKVQSAYFSGREKHYLMHNKKSPANNLAPKELDNSENKGNRWIDTYFGGLCNYLAFSKLKVKADLKQGDLLNSTSLVCSVSFDRDGDFFATAGVNKKIKVYEYKSVVNEKRDIHCPVVELGGRSKIGSTCWNEWMTGLIASSNFQGVVQVWDVATSRALVEMREHVKRVWSIDFSVVNPKLLASGSDDGSVKLWDVNQRKSVDTIRTKANVCCVQFPLDSSRILAFGSADHKIYYYDIRNSKDPLITLVGHNKAVSYVKFVDTASLVSASIDNTLKLWDLSSCTSRVLDRHVQSYTGHLNLRNFVGLSVSQGYIATGSETNEVIVYHRDFPVPSLSLKFNSTDSVSGDEVEDGTQFISALCWRGQTSTLVAANSAGDVKVMDMV